jgi:hypothetical protein
LYFPNKVPYATTLTQRKEQQLTLWHAESRQEGVSFTT